jgi:hypothetical protein
MKSTLKTKDISSVIEWDGAEIKITSTQSEYGHNLFKVRLVKGEWPSDEDLAILCDGGVPPIGALLGYEVVKKGRAATIKIYTD